MRVLYRALGDRLLLRLEGDPEDEHRVWRLLATMGCPTQSEQVPGTLVWQRWIPREALPRLERAARMGRLELAPEAGEAVVASATEQRRSYEAARPLDPAAVLAAAKADPAANEPMLADAYVRFEAWARAHHGWTEARADLEALGAALQVARAENRRRAAEAQTEEKRSLSEQLRGVAGEDIASAHAALKRLQEVAARVPPPDPAKAYEMPENIAHFLGKLRPYQVEGVRFLLRRGLNAILADQMGLGKTVMAIAAVEAADERALVVGPANVLYNWKDEVERFTDEPCALYHRGALMGPTDARFLITTYDALQRSTEAFDEQLASRAVVVLDEAHYVRNPQTQRSHLVRALPEGRRILLTGTPLVNTIEDYYELLRLVEPKRWGSRSQFRESWLVDPGLFNKYSQVRTATANLLQRAARDVMLRRRKEEVLAELPPRTISVLHVELEGPDLVAYRQLEARAEETLQRETHNELAVFAAIHALRQHLALARVPAAAERARELLDAGECVVLYAHYLEPLHLLAKEFGPIAAVIEGATPPLERQRIARTLGQEGGARLLLAQMEAGGVGLNFTAATRVLFLHFGWTPAVHAQAMDRVHRIGQSKPVFVEFFVTPDTIDERMARILLRKEADQNLVLADASDVHNRSALAQVLAEDAASRVREAKAASMA